MTKRPPEMVELTKTRVAPWGLLDDVQDIGDEQSHLMVDAGKAEAAIRSLRVKLFRERAQYYTLLSEEHYELYAIRAYRFTRIADAIERGER